MSLAEASALLGTPQNTIRSRFKAGKLRGERDNSGKIWVWIDPKSAPSKPVRSKPSDSQPSKASVDAALEVMTAAFEQAQRELEALREKASRVDQLEAEKAMLISQISDLKEDRDAWRNLKSKRSIIDFFRRR